MFICSPFYIYIGLCWFTLVVYAMGASEPSGPSWIKANQQEPVKRPSSQRRLATINFKDSEYYTASGSSGTLNFTEIPTMLDPVLILPENGNFSTVAGIFVEAQESPNIDISSIYIYYAINGPLTMSSKYILREGVITLSTTGITTLSFAFVFAFVFKCLLHPLLFPPFPFYFYLVKKLLHFMKILRMVYIDPPFKHIHITSNLVQDQDHMVI